MKRIFLYIVIVSLLSGCTSATPNRVEPPTMTAEVLPVSTPIEITSTPAISESAVSTETVNSAGGIEPAGSPAASDDLFAGISLPAPICPSVTQSQTEGPYYKTGSPERNSLLETGVEGTRLILVGYVLDQNCDPLPNAWLDFWQANTIGEYDNEGYRLRGHQFTDEQGLYYLETVLPGLYESRPIEHIHVKVRPEGGEEVTSQLYFPNQPIEGLTVTLEDRGDYQIGYFNFVVQR